MKVEDITAGGEPLDHARVYTVACPDFVAQKAGVYMGVGPADHEHKGRTLTEAVTSRAPVRDDRRGPPRGASCAGERGAIRELAHEIDYELIGDDMQMVVVTLDPGEAVLAEAGAMRYMTAGVEMDTRLDPLARAASSAGSQGRAMLTGESFFITDLPAPPTRARPSGVRRALPRQDGALRPPRPRWQGALPEGRLPLRRPRIDIGVEFTKRLGAGFFGGEGFILQRLSRRRAGLRHAGGTIIRSDLAAGQNLRVDTGCLVAFTAGVDYDIRLVGGFTTALFGGEGLFLAHLTGPGRVCLQTLPFSRLADRIEGRRHRNRGEHRGVAGLGRQGAAQGHHQRRGLNRREAGHAFQGVTPSRRVCTACAERVPHGGRACRRPRRCCRCVSPDAESRGSTTSTRRSP